MILQELLALNEANEDKPKGLIRYDLQKLLSDKFGYEFGNEEIYIEYSAMGNENEYWIVAKDEDGDSDTNGKYLVNIIYTNGNKFKDMSPLPQKTFKSLDAAIKYVNKEVKQ